MATNNPVALPLVLTVLSCVVAGYAWNSTPDTLPLWWSAHGHPIWWVPRWLGLLLFPFLQLAIPYIMYQVASRDENLDGQRGESAYAVANIIALPGLLVFAEYVLVYVGSATSDSHDFSPRLFTANLAIWALFWLGYNLQYVEPNYSIGVLVFFPLVEKELWTRVHLYSGRILMVLGVVLFIFALACPVGVVYMVLVIVIWLGAYCMVLLNSYLIFRFTRQQPSDLEQVSAPMLTQEQESGE